MTTRERIACALVHIVATLIMIAMFYVATEPTYNAVDVIDGHMYVIDHGLSLEDCVSTGAPICEEN